MFFLTPFASRFLPSAVLAFALAFFLDGCGGEHPLDSEPAVAPGPNGKPLPLMKAKDAFFDGKVLAEIMLSQSRGKGGFKPAPIPGMPTEEEQEFSSDDDDTKITEDMVETLRSRRSESPISPIVMGLQLTSAAGNPLTVEIIDFKSDLGDFVMQPDHFAIAPGQSVQPEPVISRLGVTSLEIPVTVTLRLNGKTETHILTLRPVAAAAPPPAAHN
jgi:hypothetical protein